MPGDSEHPVTLGDRLREVIRPIVSDITSIELEPSQFESALDDIVQAMVNAYSVAGVGGTYEIDGVDAGVEFHSGPVPYDELPKDSETNMTTSAHPVTLGDLRVCKFSPEGWTRTAGSQ